MENDQLLGRGLNSPKWLLLSYQQHFFDLDITVHI